MALVGFSSSNLWCSSQVNQYARDFDETEGNAECVSEDVQRLET